MSARRVHVDTDPGLDDLLALAFALASPELSVEGVTTVAGNAPLAAVTRNALGLLALAGRDVPVGAGAAGPLALRAIDGVRFHGADGRRSIALPEPRRAASLPSAREVLRRSLAERGVECVIALGPLTNVAELAAAEPALFARAEVVWMGGALDHGNVTPFAEFNAYADPRALRVLLESGVRLRAIGLEVTEQVAIPAGDVARSAFAPGARGRLLDASLRGLYSAERELNGNERAVLHDPCAVAAAFAPELFVEEEKALDVVDREGDERGRMLERAGAGKARVAVQVRAGEVAALFLERVTRWARAEADAA